MSVAVDSGKRTEQEGVPRKGDGEPFFFFKQARLNVKCQALCFRTTHPLSCSQTERLWRQAACLCERENCGRVPISGLGPQTWEWR